MPCMDGGPSDREIAQERVAETKKLGRMLCAILGAKEELAEIDALLNTVENLRGRKMRAEIEAWWEAHKEEDAERIAREERQRATEAAKNTALNKLTVAERRLLGLPKPKTRRK